MENSEWGKLGVRSGSLLVVCLAVCTVFVSCKSTIAGIDAAKQGVTQFHQQLDSEQYSQLYTAADEKLHQQTSESQFTGLMQAIHKKLGMVQKANLTDTRIAWYTATGETVTLDYQTTFSTGSGSAGSGTEEFIWHISGDRALLYGYHINSNDLIVRWSACAHLYIGQETKRGPSLCSG